MASHKSHVVDTTPAIKAIVVATKAFEKSFPPVPKNARGRVDIGGGITMRYDSKTSSQHASILRLFKSAQRKILELGLDVRFEPTKKEESAPKKKGGRRNLK